MKTKPNWLMVVGLSLGGLCLLGCAVLGAIVMLSPSIYKYSLNNSSLAVGDAAPDFELTALTGESIRLSQFRGQPVLLSVGASWCPDCRVEAPLLEELHRTHPELVILLIESKEAPEVVQRYVDELGLTHPVLLDRDGKVQEMYKILAIPTELFIDEQGVIKAKIIEKVTPQLLAENLPLIGINP